MSEPTLHQQVVAANIAAARLSVAIRYAAADVLDRLADFVDALAMSGYEPAAKLARGDWSAIDDARVTAARMRLAAVR